MRRYIFFGVAFVVCLFLLISTAETIWTIPLFTTGIAFSFVFGKLWKEWVVVQTLQIDGITVEVYNKELKLKEIKLYIERAKLAKPTAKLIKIQLIVEGEDVEIISEYAPVPFERIRRITGYLVGNLDRFNDAKASEVKDRVSHEVPGERIEKDFLDVLVDKVR